MDHRIERALHKWRRSPRACNERPGRALYSQPRTSLGICQRTATINSISTGTPRGNSATPTALRACRPAPSNARPSRLDAASITCGC